MTLIPIIFLVLEFALIAIGVLIGYRRGVGKSLVRLVYLAILGIVAFFVGRSIAFSLSDTACTMILPMLPEEILPVFEKSPELEPLVANMIGGLLSAILVSLVFALLRLLSLIGFNKLSGMIAKRFGEKEPLAKGSKWWGLAVGFVYSTLAASLMLLPIFTPMYILNSVPDETIAVYYEAVLENYTDQPNYEETEKLLTETKPSFNATKFFPFSCMMADAVTSYGIPDTEVSESVTHSLPAFIELGSDALYVHNSTVYAENPSTVVLNNASATVTLHLENSPTIKRTAACVVSALGEILREDGEFMGMGFAPTNNFILDSLISMAIGSVADTDYENVNNNMMLLFGTYDAELLPEHKRSNFEMHFPASGYVGKEQKGLLLIIYELEFNSLDDLIGNEDLQNIINQFSGLLDPDSDNTENTPDHSDHHELDIPPSVIEEFIESAHGDVSVSGLKEFLNSMGYNPTDEEMNAIVKQYLG